MIKLFSAFAGYGTDNFALKSLGIEFECVGFSEIDKYAIECFEKNHCYKFPDMLKGEVIRPHNFGDISKMDWNIVPDFDLLTGGFPCQDVSVAGKQDLNKGRTILGMELTKALKIKQPKYFLFENVKGLMIKKFEEFRKQLVKSWEDCGYKVYSEVLNTKDFGIPQSRPRVFFVGIREDINQDFKFPEKEELKIFIKDILEQNVDEKYLLKEHQVKKLLEGIEKKNRFMQSKLQNKDYAFALKGRDYKEPKVVQVFDIHRNDDVREYLDCSNTLSQAMGTGGNNVPIVNIFALRSYPRTNNPEQDKEIGRFQNMEMQEDGCSNSLTGVEKDNLVIDKRYKEKGRIYDGISPTLNSHGDTKGGIVTPIVVNLQPREGKGIGGKGIIFKEDGTAYCLDSNNGQAIIEDKKFIDVYNNKVQDLCPALTEPNHNSLRVFDGVFRRLTPKECFRLQGFLKDEINLDGLSDTQAYRLAGNGQSVNVVAKILNELNTTRKFFSSKP